MTASALPVSVSLVPLSMADGLGMLFDPVLIFAIFLGTAVGIIFGAIPGFSATMTIILFTPVTIPFSRSFALIFLISAYGGAVYGGSIPAILINTPGAPGSVVTCWDGYELTRDGKAIYTLAVSAIVSSFAGLIAAVVLLFIGPRIADFALEFGHPQMFLLVIFALTIIPAAKGASLSKSLLGGLFGLSIATVGTDPQLARPRGTYGFTILRDGVDFIVILIALFVLAEMIQLAYRGTVIHEDATMEGGIGQIRQAFRAVWDRPVAFFRGTAIGVFIGSLPGAGADVANFVSYNEAQRWAREEIADKFGTGIIEGVIAADSSNNATQGGALIPTLTLGIPGSGSTAALLGAIALHGLHVGPGLFERSPTIVYAMIFSLFIGNALILVYGVPGSRYFGRLAYIPVRYIIPAVVVFAVVGAFAVRYSLFDLWMLWLFGIVGLIFVAYEYPLVSPVLGVILGGLAEDGFVRGWLLTGSDVSAFLFDSPVSIAILVLIFVSIAVTIVKN